MDISRLEENGIAVKTGMAYTGGEEKYLSALQRFYKGYESNDKAVKDFLSAKDIKNYEIKVHALKSNARMIGANHLADAFEALETAAKSGEISLMQEKTPAALAEYARVIDILRPIGEMEPVSVKGELTADEARQTAEKLLAALDDFDDDLSCSLANTLMGYPFRITQKTVLKDAIRHISDFMYEEAADLIQSIIPAIE